MLTAWYTRPMFINPVVCPLPRSESGLACEPVSVGFVDVGQGLLAAMGFECGFRQSIPTRCFCQIGWRRTWPKVPIKSFAFWSMISTLGLGTFQGMKQGIGLLRSTRWIRAERRLRWHRLLDSFCPRRLCPVGFLGQRFHPSTGSGVPAHAHHVNDHCPIFSQHLPEDNCNRGCIMLTQSSPRLSP